VPDVAESVVDAAGVARRGTVEQDPLPQRAVGELLT
jgi:hypothetical protein